MSSLPIISLILSNLVLVWGFLFWGWSFGNIIILYWFESIVIGFYTILKMVMAQNTGKVKFYLYETNDQRLTIILVKIFLILFFITHFGGFIFGHGLFLLALFGKQIIFQKSLFISIISMFLSHGISFIIHYLQPKTYLKTSPFFLMFRPYSRIIIVHITVLICGLFLIYQNSLIYIILFILIKTVVDLKSHIFEHSDSNSQNINTLFENMILSKYQEFVKNGQWEEKLKNMTPQEKEIFDDVLKSRGINK